MEERIRPVQNPKGYSPDTSGTDGWVGDDPVGIYLKQMSQEPLLQPHEEVALAKRIQLGREAGWQHAYLAENNPGVSASVVQSLQELMRDGQEAREHLSRANTRLVVSVAKRYMGQGLPFLDLIQEGNVGLMRAVDKFDYKRGNKFSTYATWWIRQGITRAVAQKTRMIRIPLHMTERMRQMYRTANALEQDLGRRPTPEEIASALGTTPDAVQGMLDSSRDTLSLERPIGDDRDSEFGDFVQDQSSPNPHQSAVDSSLKEAVASELEKLTPRQADILRLRFGLDGEDPHTLEEIAQKEGLSRERIRQIEKKALRRLRPLRRYDSYGEITQQRASDLEDFINGDSDS